MKISTIPERIDCWFTENRDGVCMLKLWATEAEKMDGEFGVEKPLFAPNWKVGLLLSPGEFLSPNMPLFAPNWKDGLLLSPGVFFLSPNIPEHHCDNQYEYIISMSTRNPQ